MSDELKPIYQEESQAHPGMWMDTTHFEALEQVIHKCDMYQQPQYRCVGQASALPGTGNAFTCGAFQAEDVPVGYSLYVKV